MKIIRDVADRFKNGNTGNILIIGEANSGKTALSLFAASKYFIQSKVFNVEAIPQGSTSLSQLRIQIEKATKLTGGPSFILDHIPSKSVIVFNDLELWWDRTESGFTILNEIFQLMDKYSRKIFFIVNCNVYAFKFLNMIQPIENNFIGIVRCDPFDARELKNIILPRHESSGLSLRLDSKRAQTLNKWREAKMFNKIFEYSSGVIGPALYSWITSITDFKDDIIFISYPELPSQKILDKLSSIQKIILLQFIIHNKLAANSIYEIIGIEPELIEQELTPLINYSIVNVHGDILEISPYILPFIVREFKRRDLL